MDYQPLWFFSPRFHFKWCFTDPALTHPSSCSVTVLPSYWAAAMGADEVSTAGRGRQLPPCETLALNHQAAWLLPRWTGLCSLNVLPECLKSWGQTSCCCDATETVSYQEQLCMVRQYSHLQVTVKFSFLGTTHFGQNWRPLLVSHEKWASNGMVVKRMISSLWSNAMLTKIKWH